MIRREFIKTIGLMPLGIFGADLLNKFSFKNKSSGAYALSPVIKDGKYGFIDTKTNLMIVPYQFDDAEPFCEGLSMVTRYQRSSKLGINKRVQETGYIDESGKQAIPFFECLYSSRFSHGRAMFRTGSDTACVKEGFIDRRGTVVIPPKFTSASVFKNGFSCVQVDDKYGFIDTSGNLICNCEFDVACNFGDNGRALVYIGDKFGWIDSSGQVSWQA